MSKFRRHLRVAASFLSILVVLTGASTKNVFALTQQDLYTENIYLFNIAQDCGGDDVVPDSTGQGQSNSGTSKLPYLSAVPLGKNTKEQIWYFFTKEVGLSPEGTAGIMGNMQAESGFNPASAQTSGAWQDMSSRNINNGGGGGVGLVQWDGGRRPAYINYAESHKADPKSIVPQLNYIWKELNSNYTQALSGLQSASSPEDAAYAFHKYYEISADSEDRIRNTRMKYARDAYNTYFSKTITGTVPTSSTDNPCGDEDNNGSVSVGADCGNATGNARIICAAKMYDPASYYEGYEGGHQGAAAWHKDCDTTYHYAGTPPGRTLNGNAVGPKCFVDCSGLVNMAVYDVFKVELRENTGGERADIGKYWRKLANFSDLRPGDIVQPNSGHVEIVDSVQGNHVKTFGAHTARYPQPRQVSPGGFDKKSGQLYLRYIGPGGEK
jgi:hypothetical protein